jgi:hypothetical protein
MALIDVAKKWFKLCILRMNDKIAYMLVSINQKTALNINIIKACSG